MKRLIKCLLLFFTLVFLLGNKRVYAVDTVIGSLQETPLGFTQDILSIGTEMAGGIAFLLMVYGGFLFLTSSGDPNKLQEATDVIMSAIAGLLMIIFSVFLLSFLGKDILLIF